MPLIVASARPAQVHSLGLTEGVSVDESGALSVIWSEVAFASGDEGSPVVKLDALWSVSAPVTE